MITRRPPSDPPTAAHPASVPTAPGALRCSNAGCTAVTGLACAYVDRRGRRCDTAWCPEHRAVVGEAPYCRRHAGVVTAIAAVDESPASPPDLDNRAASLVMWVGHDLEDRVRMLVEPRAGQTGLELVDEPIRFVHRELQRPRAWVRGWKLIDQTGVRFSIAVAVEEDRPDEVVVRSGLRELARAVPPWIGRRSPADPPAAGDDARERAAFYGWLLQAIAAELTTWV